MKIAIELLEEHLPQKLVNITGYHREIILSCMQYHANDQVAAERERIKKELLDIINLYNDNEMFGYSVAKNAIENL